MIFDNNNDIQWNLCNPILEFSDIGQKFMVPECQFRQIPL